MCQERTKESWVENIKRQWQNITTYNIKVSLYLSLLYFLVSFFLFLGMENSKWNQKKKKKRREMYKPIIWKFSLYFVLFPSFSFSRIDSAMLYMLHFFFFSNESIIMLSHLLFIFFFLNKKWKRIWIHTHVSVHKYMVFRWYTKSSY